jgi:predicted nucleic acid-binding protein
VILVDSSVWIAHLRGHQTSATARLEAAASGEPLLIGDLILLEVLRGARDAIHAARIERGLRGTLSCRFWMPVLPLAPPEIITGCVNWAL